MVSMRRFCYKCGRLEDDAGPLIKGLCQRCFSEALLLEAPSEIEVVVCKGCGAYRLGRQWRSPVSGATAEDAVRETVLDTVRVYRYGESGAVTLRPAEADGVYIDMTPSVNKNLVKIRGSGKTHPLQERPKVEELTLKLNLKYITCDVCSLKSAKHHDAILQLRGASSRELLSRAQRAVENVAARAGRQEPRDFIADVEEKHGGLDFYVSSVSLAKKMAALLKDKFKADIVESAKLIGQTQDGRKKYRVSILARLER